MTLTERSYWWFFLCEWLVPLSDIHACSDHLSLCIFPVNSSPLSPLSSNSSFSLTFAIDKSILCNSHSRHRPSTIPGSRDPTHTWTIICHNFERKQRWWVPNSSAFKTIHDSRHIAILVILKVKCLKVYQGQYLHIRAWKYIFASVTVLAALAWGLIAHRSALWASSDHCASSTGNLIWFYLVKLLTISHDIHSCKFDSNLHMHRALHMAGHLVHSRPLE